MPARIDFKKIWTGMKTSLANAKKILWIIGRHAFAVILILILLDVLFGGFLFYKYVYSAENKNPDIDGNYFKFNDTAYQQVLTQWQSRDQKLQDFLQKNYPSPF